MKKIFLLIAIASSLFGAAQNYTGDYLEARKSFKLRQARIDSIMRDTTGIADRDNAVMTAASVYNFVVGRLAGITPGGGSTDLSGIRDTLSKKIPAVIGKTSSSVIDRNVYDGFPTVAQSPKKDTVFIAWKSGADHVTNGPIYYTYSVDGGGDWKPYDTIKVDNVNMTNVATVSLGYTNNKLVIAYNITDAYTRFAYNTGRSAEGFIGLDSVAATSSQGIVQSFGDAFTIVSDTIYFPAYAINSGQDTSQAFLYKSSGTNLSFSVGQTIIKTKMGNTFPEGIISETTVAVAIKGATDATSTLMAITRSDSYKAYHYQSYSTNGGQTWTKITADWAFGSLNPGATTAYPVKMIVKDQTLYAIACVRETATGNQHTRIFRMPVTSYATANSWTSTNGRKFTIPYRSLVGYKAGHTDNGYASGFFTPTGKLRQVQYDASPRWRNGIDGLSQSARIRIVSTPIENFYWFEANRTTNQAITTGTETTVSFSNIIYDTDHFWNADSTAIEFPEDGLYQIEALFRVDTTSFGTKIIGKLLRVDRGFELGTTPSLTWGHSILDYKAIQPSTDADLTWITLTGMCYGYKGMRVRATITHDKGSDLNIVNDGTGYLYVPYKNATMRIKKID